MPTTEELLKQVYKQQTQSQQGQNGNIATTSADASAANPPASTEAPAAGAGTENTPQAPANGESTAPAADTAGTGDTGLTGEASGKSLWDRYRDYLGSLGDYKTPTANSQEELIRKMYEANLASNKSQLESDYNQNLSDLGAEESKLGQIYYEQQRQAQAESDRNRQAFQEYANARGLNSGTGGQAELAQSNQLSANLNALRQSEAEKRAEVERQRQLLGQQYQQAIQKAQADNDLNLAKALYEEAVRVDESITSAAQADADRALQIFNMDKAIESRYTDANKSGTKADEYLKAYRQGELNDAMALAVLSDKEVMAYDRFGRGAKVTPEMALQAANAHAGMKDVKDEDGKVTSSAQDQFDAWLEKQSWTDDQKSAVRMGFYSDSVKTYSYLPDQLRKGNIKTADAKSELTTSYQAGWSKNVRDTGAKMADYIDAIVEYEDRPSSEELDDAGYSYVWQWFCDYLNTTDLTREQKYAMAISIKKNDYGEGTMKKIWNRLR